MKNRLIIFFFSLLFYNNSFAENISITAKNILLDKEKNKTIFENEVIVKTSDHIIKSQFAEYDRGKGFLILKDEIVITDNKKNKLNTNYAEFYEEKDVFITKGKTKVETIENYILNGEDLIIDNQKKIIKSEKNSILIDKEDNNIFLDNFEYDLEKSLFKSIGNIQIFDNRKNEYQFSQVYIDTNKKEILGTDSKTFFNDPNLKLNQKNDPRIFSNTVNLKKEKSIFEKSVFTLCSYRKEDSCPPWTIQSKKMLHDAIKKTIYYDNAIVKVYDIPIFYFPKLSHPDPTVDRRSGFLIPSFYDSRNLGSGISIPYFFDLGVNKNFTLNNRLYVSENPLFLGEYHQAFKNSNFITDFGFTEGYKKNNNKKRSGEKSHFFAKFVKNFPSIDNYETNLELNFQEVSDDKYLKLYKIDSNIVDYNTETLENSINFTQDRDDMFIGLNASIYETLKSNYEDKYEYILPELTIDKSVFSNEKLGGLDLQTNFKVHNYDTNKFTNFLVNDLNYESNDKIFKNIINHKYLLNLKNINYESRNVNLYKEEPTSEIFGSLGLLSEINFQKISDKIKHSLKPKMLIRYAPGNMRKETESSKLTASNAFTMNRVSNLNNYETGLTSALGVDYKIKNFNNVNKLDFSLAQIINEKENKKMGDKSSLNEKLSDLVGSSNLYFNENFSMNYNFSLDQNYNDLNYNEIGAKYNNESLDLGFNYLKEEKHLGNQDYFKAEINYKNDDKGLLSFKTKRNLVTNSSEFYNLSYEYINDCLRAGLVYRREFYNDSELEPEDSLMFKLTLIPFGNLDSPSLN